MRTAAILPVKRFSKAKSRLGASVVDPLRTDLARAMVGDVLTALGAAASLERTIVVTAEESVARAAGYLGALVVPDAAERGQSAAVALGVAAAQADGFERVLCIPGDCPALDPAEIDLLLAPTCARAHTHARTAAKSDISHTARDPDGDSPPQPTPHASTGAMPLHSGYRNAADRPDVTIVPDRHGTGTNGLLLTPPDAIAPSFGPDSCERHRALARAAGARCRIERPASLLLDIDTGEDLRALRERLIGERVRAPRTRAVLGLTAAAGTIAGSGSAGTDSSTPAIGPAIGAG